MHTCYIYIFICKCDVEYATRSISISVYDIHIIVMKNIYIKGGMSKA